MALMGERRHGSSARTLRASGRAVYRCAAALLLAVAASGCGALRGGGRARAERPLPEPVLSRERPSRSAEVAASQLFQRATEAQAAGDLNAARTAAAEVVDRYPGAQVSGRALRLLAEVAFAQQSWKEADLLAQRWIRLVPENDPRVPPLRLVQGESRLNDNDAAGAVDRLAALSGAVPPDVAARALSLVRQAGLALDAAAIDVRLPNLPARHPFVAPLLAARARALYNAGETEQARSAAQAALGAGARDSDEQLSRAVLEGRVEPSLGLVGPVTVLGVLLSKTGPPTLTRFATEVEEGIRAAAAAARLPGRLQIVVEDDRGTAEGAAAGMRKLEQAGALAVVGPLEDAEVIAAAGARARPIPVLSPTAAATGSGPNVYTLGGADVEGARELAQWAAASGLRRVVMLYPRGQDAEDEARAFEDVLRAAGGTVPGKTVYAPRTTYFEKELRAIAAQRPDAVFLPVPPEEVGTVASQITFFGLDTLGIRVLGTAGWTREDVLAKVDPRHTDGVVSATADPGTPGAGGMRGLVSAYESLYKRTLRSAVPAVGYDAASVLLQALRAGVRTPAGVARELERIETFPGATGELGVEAGHITRRYRIVCLQNRALLPIRPGEKPTLVDRRPKLLPGEKPPALEGRPVVIVCPGAAVTGNE